MKRKRILMACVHSWNSPMRLGSHHLAREFVKNGWDVAFVSPPVTPFHLLTQNWGNIQFRVKNYLRGGTHDLDGHLWAYDSAALVVPKLRRWFDTAFLAKHWMKTMVPSLPWMLKKRGFGKVDLIYFDTPLLSFLLEEIDHRKSVLRIADNYHGFGVFPQSVLALLDELASNVDCVLYTAKNLLPYVHGLKPKTMHFFPNGVDFQHFVAGSTDIPREYREIDGQIAVYVGAIEKWFDFDLLAKAAEAFPEVSFVVIGPRNEFSNKLPKKQNILFLGPKSFSELPKYLHNAHVGLIPFDVKNHSQLLDSVNPLKLYEYLACGLPVVSTEWSELRRLESPAILSDNAAGFLAGIRVALKSNFNKVELVEFARKFDWSSRVIELEKIIFPR